MRRLRPAILALYAAMLLFAQQGALLHELSHAYYSAQSAGGQLTTDRHLPDNDHCPACRSFGQVTNPVSGSQPGLHIPLAARLRVPERVYSIIGAKAPTARSRGPPQASV